MITRFAPSPTGLLHLGHAYAAIIAHDRAGPGRFLLRIEDTDRSRCRPAFEAAILTDLRWLGLTWQTPVLRQSDHLPVYDAALNRLIAAGLCYPCRCTRADIQAALSAPQEGHQSAPYPGTCRHRPMQGRHPGDAIRLNLARAWRAISPSNPPRFYETGPAAPGWHHLSPTRLAAGTGDIVLSRKDFGPAYHLCVVIDDARQGITEVTRGEDLFDATPVQVLLQTLLGLPTPAYHHHRLIRDDQAKRLAKRDDACAIARYRDDEASPQDIRRLLNL